MCLYIYSRIKENTNKIDVVKTFSQASAFSRKIRAQLVRLPLWKNEFFLDSVFLVKGKTTRFDLSQSKICPSRTTGIGFDIYQWKRTGILYHITYLNIMFKLT